MKEIMRNRFARWRKSKDGREYLAVLFVDCDGKCPKCLQPMVLTYEDKTYENRATFNHKIHISVAPELALEDDNLEILCWTCNEQDGIKYNHEKSQLRA